jgi:hypothetical protein
MKKVQEEYDHLLETSPLIPESIVNQFNQEYKDSKVDKPEICGMIEPTKVYTPITKESSSLENERIKETQKESEKVSIEVSS